MVHLSTLPKPFDLPKAIELIRRALEESQREEVAEELMADTPEMLGQAPAMQDVFRAIGRLSQSNVTVMITGESGSGKELVARALAQTLSKSKRALSLPSIQRPFPKTCWRASSLVTSAALSLARKLLAVAGLNRRKAGPCF
jgi:Mrp family chromosome partitioning ATPase